MKKKERKEKKPKKVKAIKKVKNVKKLGKKKIVKKEGKVKNTIIDKKDQEKNKNIDKINKILGEDKIEEANEFDLLFLIDATGSMGPYIDAARDETENISKELRKSYPEMNFQYGYVFYRDPIDSVGDKHEVINLTDNVNSIPEKIKKIVAQGEEICPKIGLVPIKRQMKKYLGEMEKKLLFI